MIRLFFLVLLITLAIAFATDDLVAWWLGEPPVLVVVQP